MFCWCLLTHDLNKSYCKQIPHHSQCCCVYCFSAPVCVWKWTGGPESQVRGHYASWQPHPLSTVLWWGRYSITADEKAAVLVIFSSPEHKVLMVSYCGQWLSVVRCASTFDVYSLETTFVIRFLWNLVKMFVLTISRPSLNMVHVGSKTRSPGQILGHTSLHSRGHISKPDFDETWSECLFWQYLGQVWIWVMSGQKRSHQVKS